MRCRNCGWPNRPEETNCTKCGTVLENLSVAKVPDESSSSNQTVRESDVFGLASQPNICSKCGYPLRPGIERCPNCNSLINSSLNTNSPQNIDQKPIRRPTIIGSSNLNGTINVWTQGPIGITPSFILSPIKKFGERNQPKEIELEGESVMLNRDNTDPGNLSITSRTQAIIFRKDNKWYIEDKSEQKTTFIQASIPLEIHDGDTILLGNRLFKFHE